MQATLIPMPERIKPMLAKANPYGDAVWDVLKTLDEEENFFDNYAVECKYDGTRIIAIKNKHGVFLMSARSWKQDFASHYPEIVDAIEGLNCESCILDGELTFFRNYKNVFFSAGITRQTMIAEQLQARYIVFDVLEWNGDSLCDDEFRHRRQFLVDHIDECPILYCSSCQIGNYFEARDYYEALVYDYGDEGVVLKRLDSKYVQNARTNDWIKIKRVETDDLYLLGTTQGTGKRAGKFGALILGNLDEHGMVDGDVVKCGTGFTDAMIDELDAWIMKQPEVAPYFPTKGLDVRRVIAPKTVVEVKFMERSKNTIRHPVFVRLRDDKE